MGLNPVTIGDATLYLGEVADILPGLRADLVVADPPYGIGESGRKNRTRGGFVGGKLNTKGAYVPPSDYGAYEWDDAPPSADELALTIAAGANCIVWGGNHFCMPAASKWLVWDKLNTGDFADCEIAWTNLPGAVRIFRHMWNGMLRETERDTPRVHPTQKPIALMGWCLDQVPAAKVIGEPWMGSAPAGCAAIARGLRWWGIENNERNFDIACQRISQAHAQGVLFEPEQPRPVQMVIEVAP